MDSSSATTIPADELSLRDIARILFAGRRMVFATTIVCTIACVCWALFSTPIYRSSAVLVPVKFDRSLTSGGLSSSLGQIGGLATLAGLSFEAHDSRLEEAIAVLQSRKFIERFMADHNLLPVIFYRKWDSHSQKWVVPASRIPTPWKGYRYFIKKMMTIERDKKTGLVTVHVDWKNRAEAADWANELVERLNDEMRARAIEEATLSVRYLEQERPQTQYIQTQEAIDRLLESQIREKMLATVTKEYVFRTVDRALPADVDDIYRPIKALLILVGVVGGALLGCAIVLVRFSYRTHSDRTA